MNKPEIELNSPENAYTRNPPQCYKFQWEILRDKNIGWTQHIFISKPTGRQHIVIAIQIKNYTNTTIHINRTNGLSLFFNKGAISGQ
jgi:hypothetical protein